MWTIAPHLGRCNRSLPIFREFTTYWESFWFLRHHPAPCSSAFEAAFQLHARLQPSGPGFAPFPPRFSHREELMLRITTITATDSSTTLKLEGKISSEWVALLDRECRNVMSRKLPVVLDMTSVTY